MMERVQRVDLEVADLKRSLAFYQDCLRFALEALAPQARDQVALHAGGVRLTLRQRRRQATRPRGHSGITVVVAVQGVDSYYQALVARGALPSPPCDDDTGRWFAVTDPDGYRWAFIESTP